MQNEAAKQQEEMTNLKKENTALKNNVAQTEPKTEIETAQENPAKEK